MQIRRIRARDVGPRPLMLRAAPPTFEGAHDERFRRPRNEDGTIDAGRGWAMLDGPK